MILKILKNKILIYLVSRYGTYAIQLLVSMVIEARLGPYYLGIYGFVNLIISYFGQIHFGVPHSLNVLLVHHKDDRTLCGNYTGNALWLYGILNVIVILLYVIVKLFDIQINKDYPIDNYLLLITAIAILTYINSILTTVLRVKNKVNQLSVVQSLNVILNLCVVFVFNGETLILALLITNLFACILTVLITLRAKVIPNISEVSLSKTIQKEIINKGFYLFLYNSCFYFILISIRTIISGNYTVEEFGAFTFSFTIANAVMLLLESLMTIIFPKIIDLLSSDNHEQIERTLENMRLGYVSTSHLLIYVAMLFFPLLVYILPKYSNAVTSMNLIALAVLMNTISCGYTSLLIAKNKEKTAAMISFLALILNVILGLLLVNVFNVEFSFVILATLITYLFFSFMCVWKGRELLSQLSFLSTLRVLFPIRLLVPYVCALLISISKIEYLIWIPLVVYLILNWRDIITMKDMVFKIINNPNIADI